MRGMIVFAVALAGSSSLAMAQSETGRCFDKGTLTYYDCPSASEPREVFAAPTTAPAPAVVDDSGFYVGARGGLMFPDEVDSGGASADFEMGYTIGGLVGYDFGDVSPGVGLRAELEGGYGAADVDSFSTGGSAGGGVDTLYGFLNAYGDIGILPSLDLILGGGVGLAQVSADGISVNGVTFLDDDDVTFGYHLDAGLGLALAPNVTVEAMYRYASFIDAELTNTLGVSDEVDFNSHQALLGLRFDL